MTEYDMQSHDSNAEPREPRHRHTNTVGPLVYAALIMSILALIVSLVTVMLVVTKQSTSSNTSSAVSSASAPSQHDDNEQQSSTPANSSQWILEDGITEGDTYGNVHFKLVGLSVQGKTATLTIEAVNKDADNQGFCLSSISGFQNGVQTAHFMPNYSQNIPTLQPNASATVTYEGTINDDSPLTIEIDSLGPHMQDKISATYKPAE